MADIPSSVDYECPSCKRVFQIYRTGVSGPQYWEHQDDDGYPCTGRPVRMCLHRIKMTCMHIPGECHVAPQGGVV